MTVATLGTGGEFTPDYRHFLSALHNRRPARLPLYEHSISPTVMERVIGVRFAHLFQGDAADHDEFCRNYCRFFREMTYDVIPYEEGITANLPDHGALFGRKPGPIQSRSDFEAYPWDDIPRAFWKEAEPRFAALARAMPRGMKAVGGVGNGLFEISEDLVGLEYLPFMQADDPELYRDLYRKIGDLMAGIWTEFLRRFGDTFAACRFGDDLGFRSSLLTNPRTLREHVLPQYRRIIGLIHAAGKPFIWHSCGCIFEIMDEVIATGIDAKHSNEDAIAPFSRWIEDYGGRIALLGGFDLNFLCQNTPEYIYEEVLRAGAQYRAQAQGYALGSGNSIPDYVPTENYLAMISAAQEIRRQKTRQAVATNAERQTQA